MRVDPLNGLIRSPLTLHKYSYVHGSPTAFVDPSGGEEAIQTEAAIGLTSFMATVHLPSLAVYGFLVFGLTALTVGALGFLLSLVITPSTSPDIAPELAELIRKRTEGKRRGKGDQCQRMLGLDPAGSTSRWHLQRLPIDGQTTVQTAAFRLDPESAPADGQRPSAGAQRWVQNVVGRSDPPDQAGHVIAKRFGGTTLFNQFPDGNIFPQNPNRNMGRQRVLDGQVAQLHNDGHCVCVFMELVYDSAQDTRPSSVIYAYMSRASATGNFEWRQVDSYENP